MDVSSGDSIPFSIAAMLTFPEEGPLTTPVIVAPFLVVLCSQGRKLNENLSHGRFQDFKTTGCESSLSQRGCLSFSDYELKRNVTCTKNFEVKPESSLHS